MSSFAMFCFVLFFVLNCITLFFPLSHGISGNSVLLVFGCLFFCFTIYDLQFTIYDLRLCSCLFTF